MKVSGPKIILHIEGLAVLLVAVAFYRHLGASWVTFAVLFSLPIYLCSATSSEINPEHEYTIQCTPLSAPFCCGLLLLF